MNTYKTHKTYAEAMREAIALSRQQKDVFIYVYSKHDWRRTKELEYGAGSWESTHDFAKVVGDEGDFARLGWAKNGRYNEINRRIY